jgi:dTMP kinase
VFITVEGIEGCGKSTLLTGLSARLRDAGKDVFVTREPGGTPLGEALRGIFLTPGLAVTPLAEALLMNAARAQHVAEAIAPALREGRIVLCDRFTDSTLAYQGYGRGIDLSLLQQLCRIATAEVTPGLTFVIDVSIAVSRERLRARGTAGDRMELQSDAFHERVRSGFIALAQTSSRYRVLDGTQSPEALVEAALRAVNECAA